ncbi:MAG TPA: tetratricopeptide repeat protein [Candidatus Cybelea sp.]|jgi:tetratricopeptide (TPR) repeat protein|nr:tetratricopeptide repeat protein [Candidatus Cybelea sp.]
MKSNAGFAFLRTGCLVLLATIFLLQSVLAADTNAAPVGDAKSAEPPPMSAQESLRFYLQIQEQLRNTLLAVQTNRQEAAAQAATNSQALEARLRAMEKAFADGRRDLVEGMDRSDRMVLMAAGTFASIGFLVLLLAAFLQWTAVNRLAAATASLSARPLQLTGPGEAHLPPAHVLEESSTRFLALIERLEQRIHELEASVKPLQSLPEGKSTNGDAHGSAAGSSSGASAPPAAPGQASAINVLVSKSQTLLKLDKPEAALGCLEEALALDPDNTDAMVKKGAALERLQRFDEAIECYDRAIAQDNSMTMAYLYKGGVFNRTERYTEALACYEQALKRIGKPPAKALNSAALPNVGSDRTTG